MEHGYQEFLDSKSIKIAESGFEPVELAGHLFDYQKAVVRWALKKGKACIFAGTGMGKTAMQLEWARQVSEHTGGRVLILCPLAIAHQTEKEASRFGLTAKAVREQTGDLIQIANYENLHKFDASAFTGIVLDECFPAGTMIGMAHHSKDIVDVRPGDLVKNAYGICKVEAVYKRKVEFAVRITTTDGRQIVSSGNHPYFTQRGWVGAVNLSPADRLIETSEAMRIVREDVHGAIPISMERQILRQVLLSEMENESAGNLRKSSHEGSSQKNWAEGVPVAARNTRGHEAFKTLCRPEADAESTNAGKGFAHPEGYGAPTVKAWWKRSWPNRSAEISLSESGGGMGGGISYFSGKGNKRLSDLLQSGYSRSAEENRNRGGWSLASSQEETGHKEGHETPGAGLASLEVLEQGHPDLEKYRDEDGIIYFYDLKVSQHPSYSVEGFLVHNSSILKSFSGKIRTQIIESFAETPYRLACTATPAPNDIEEIGNHAEFVGVMKRVEMLAMFFNHDGGDTSKWRLKGHAQDQFWKWMCQWAMMFTKPSDIGFSDEGFVLPELRYHDVRLQSEIKMDGMLFAVAPDLSQKRDIRKQTIESRVAESVKIASKAKGPVIVWCDYNDESTALAKAIKGAREVTGSQDSEQKELLLDGFIDGSFRVLVTKSSIAGFGLNLQHCNTMVFAGLSDSWEQFYQAVRRCWRFGQKKPVDVYIVTDGMDSTIQNIKRKEEQALTMQREMIKHMETEMKKELEGVTAQKATYERDKDQSELYTLHLGDCVEVARELPADSVDFSVFSPPFASLYTYSNSDRDMGNSRNDKEFYRHFQYLIRELERVVKPGRVVAVHCMDMPKMKGRDGEIGMKDFSGKLIRSFERCGFVYDGRITIWKNPVVEMQRTKSIRLLHKQLKKDSSVSGPSAPDYLLKFKKRGVNPNPITHTNDSFPVDLWQKIASPVWMDIDQGNTLQYMQARDAKDEKHICPLQLDVIERALRLWSQPGDVVLSPFAGIGSEGYQALKMHRRFIGIELKQSYWEVAVRNMGQAISELSQENLFPVTA